ncbi:hypothetical protein NIASO_19425 [Niabella soli DSM 19437]|uniref:Uncharacterized protein n=2 Tax=Niabella TaxID=379899 RepID=W0F998_9BACT|nr:hypothetical protein NIASO_19425 [Niabella soli DSM 19437]
MQKKLLKTVAFRRNGSSLYKIAKMKKILTLILLFLTISCGKNNETDLTACDQQMIAKFKNEVTCPYDPQMSRFLGKGMYRGQLVYFIDIVCIACNTAPPPKVYTCSGAEIPVTNFYNTVTGRIRVDACGNN